MKYWNAKSQQVYDTLCENSQVDGNVIGFEMATMKQIVSNTLDQKCPFTICAILRFCDEHQSDSSRIRFSTAVRSMSMKLYDVAYACWDDGGQAFSDVEDDATFPTGVQASSILRDLCGSMLDLQNKLRERDSEIINNELCDLMDRVF